MNPSLLRLSLLAALLGSALSAPAAMLTYDLVAKNYGGSKTVPAFDPSLGTLTSVAIAAAASGVEEDPISCNASVTVTSPAGTGVYFRHEYDPGNLQHPPYHIPDRFNDTGTVALPLSWGSQGMALTWVHGGYTVSGKYQVQLTYTPQAVPEPSAFAALGLGALGLLRLRRRTRSSRVAV